MFNGLQTAELWYQLRLHGLDPTGESWVRSMLLELLFLSRNRGSLTFPSTSLPSSRFGWNPSTFQTHPERLTQPSST